MVRKLVEHLSLLVSVSFVGLILLAGVSGAKHPLNDRFQEAVVSKLTAEDQSAMRLIADSLLGDLPAAGKLIERKIKLDHGQDFMSGLMSLMERALENSDHPLYTDYYLGDEDDSTNWDGQQGCERFREKFEQHIGRLCERVDLLLSDLVAQFWSQLGWRRRNLMKRFDQATLDWVNLWKVANTVHQEELIRRAYNFASMGIHHK